jgi:hypothetical protein
LCSNLKDELLNCTEEKLFSTFREISLVGLIERKQILIAEKNEV